MPRIHGRRPEVFPGILERCRAVFGDDETAAEMLPDGCWEITVSGAGWLRHFNGKPGMQAGCALTGWLTRD